MPHLPHLSLWPRHILNDETRHILNDEIGQMSVAVDILEDMFEYKQVSPAAAILTALTPAVAAPREGVRELQARIRQMQATKLDTRRIPTHPAIAELLPGGALRQGSAYAIGSSAIGSSATLLMALLAGPSAAGAWCGVVGVPEFGVEAAAAFGIDLDRLVLVPNPGDRWLGVTAAIVDVLGIVATRSPERLADASVARLTARLRQRGATLIVLGSWPQSEAVLSISQSNWSGIGSGHGHLSARQVTVTVTARTGRPRSARLWLPDAEENFRVAARSQEENFREVAPGLQAARSQAGGLRAGGSPRLLREAAG